MKKEYYDYIKNAQGVYDKYLYTINNYGMRRLYDVYKKPSKAKQRAWNQILTEFLELGVPESLTVISYNSNKFSVGYMTKDNIFVYETSRKTYYWKIIDNKIAYSVIATKDSLRKGWWDKR